MELLGLNAEPMASVLPNTQAQPSLTCQDTIWGKDGLTARSWRNSLFSFLRLQVIVECENQDIKILTDLEALNHGEFKVPNDPPAKDSLYMCSHI